MGVKKSVLEKMPSKELEKYIQPESKFVSEAKEYAFEILNARGYQFTEEELTRWNSLKEKDYKLPENNEVHPDYKKASTLLYISAGFGVLKFVLFGFVPSAIVILTVIFTLGFVFGLAYLTEKGYDWIKYLLLFLSISGLIPLVFMMSLTTIDVIFIIQTILQIWALIILFKIPKNV